MESPGVQASDGVIEHVRKQMQRGIIEIVRLRKNLPEMLPCDPLNPHVGSHILRIIDSEKAETQVASVKDGGRRNQQTENSDVELPRAW